MKLRRSISLMTAVFGFFAVAPLVPAQSTPLRIFVSNGVRAVVEELQPQCERAVGNRLTLEYSAAAVLKKKIDDGAAFDVALLTTEVTDQLIKEGKVTSASRADLARAGVGIGIRAGAPKPDIGTPDALKRALLSAKSITYAKDGAARVLIERIYDRLGIADEVQPKIILQAVPGTPQKAVASGAAEMVMTLVSEILPAPGIQLVGPVPMELQSYVTFRGGISAKTKNTEAAQAVVKFFSGPQAAAVYKAKGLEPAR